MQLPRNANLWFPGYLRDRVRSLRRPRARRLWVAITDHYEPLGGNVTLVTAQSRVRAWQQRWPEIAANAPRDSANAAPCFTFFYPQEEYERGLLNSLAELTRNGTADVEIHLHHHLDTAESFAHKIREFSARLRGDHGLLHEHEGEEVFGFIHGNWALDNALPNGRHCGITGELHLLRELGCYADFTMPSIPSPTQSRIVNQIYWTTGSQTLPRSFDQGVEAKPGAGRQGEMLMITGPAGLRFRKRFLPRIEAGELAVYDPPTEYRVERWLDLAPRIGEDIFLKLYGHSAREDNAGALLGTGSAQGALAPMFQWIHEAVARRGLELHWVSAFEMFKAVDALVQPAARSVAQHERPLAAQ